MLTLTLVIGTSAPLPSVAVTVMIRDSPSTGLLSVTSTIKSVDSVMVNLAVAFDP